MLFSTLRILLFALFILLFQPVWSQTHTPKYIPIAPNANGYYEYLPAGYNPNGNQKYPVILFLHGAGDLGNGSVSELSRLLLVGIPKLINEGNFPTSFTVNNQTSSFIVISPQFTYWPSRAASVVDIESILNYIQQYYKADINRIYVTGLSMGGGFAFDYAGASNTNANRLAAILPIAEASGAIYSQARTIAGANLPVWATHNNQDPNVPLFASQQYVDWINEAPSANPNARLSVFDSAAHDAWTRTYNPNFTENGLNVYQWMLTHRRYFNLLPVQLSNYKAYVSGSRQTTITWSTTNEVNNDHFTIERSADGNRFNTIATVQGLNRDNTYTYLDVNPLQGDNYYRLSQTDRDGRTTYFEILKVRSKTKSEFTISPNPVSNVLRLELFSEDKGPLTASIFNISGVLVKQWELTKQDYQFNESVSVANLAKGSYVLQLQGDLFKETKQFIKY